MPSALLERDGQLTELHAALAWGRHGGDRRPARQRKGDRAH